MEPLRSGCGHPGTATHPRARQVRVPGGGVGAPPQLLRRAALRARSCRPSPVARFAASWPGRSASGQPGAQEALDDDSGDAPPVPPPPGPLPGLLPPLRPPSAGGTRRAASSPGVPRFLDALPFSRAASRSEARAVAAAAALGDAAPGSAQVGGSDASGQGEAVWADGSAGDREQAVPAAGLPAAAPSTAPGGDAAPLAAAPTAALSGAPPAPTSAQTSPPPAAPDGGAVSPRAAAALVPIAVWCVTWCLTSGLAHVGDAAMGGMVGVARALFPTLPLRGVSHEDIAVSLVKGLQAGTDDAATWARPGASVGQRPVAGEEAQGGGPRLRRAAIARVWLRLARRRCAGGSAPRGCPLVTSAAPPYPCPHLSSSTTPTLLPRNPSPAPQASCSPRGCCVP